VHRIPLASGSKRFPLALIVLLLGSALALSPGAAAEERTDPVRVQVSVDVSEDSTRLLLTHSRHLAYAISQSKERLEIVYAGPIQVEPPERSVGDSRLAGWTAPGQRTLVLNLGPGFQRFDSFELRNPTRLVLDLLGDGSAVSGTAPVPTRPAKPKPGLIVVVDPGHGGVERGAAGPTGLTEKDVTLDLARRLRSVLQSDGKVTVVLTREDDRLVGLDERTAVANHNKAHLFVSIHLNSSRRKTAYGAETYYLSTEATDDEARTLAALENKAYTADEPLDFEVEGEEKKKTLELILWDLAQNQYLAESSRLAERMQRELNELTGTRDRGVRQAPFRVLMGATMPAILVEVGFISNPEEEERFKTSSYRDRVVEAMARAVRGFLSGLKRASGPEGQASPAGAASAGGVGRP
jgi:N-acetylmuramoyl-L-alanine amidase